MLVTKLDRLARSIAELITLIQTLEKKAVGLCILNLGTGTQIPTDMLMLTVWGGVAQCEREIILELQQEGVAKAKVTGKYKGRNPWRLSYIKKSFATP